MSYEDQQTPAIALRAICGLAAVHAVFQQRPDSVLRLFFDAQRAPKARDWSKLMAANRKVYRLVEPEELEKIAKTVHHGGVVAIVEDEPPRRINAEVVRTWAKEHRPLIILDRIGNTHNLGAIARSAAFLGYGDIIIEDHPEQASLAASAYRVAKGGLDLVRIYSAKDLPRVVAELRHSHAVIGASVSPDSTPLAALQLDPQRPVALILGNEEHGLGRDVEALCQHLVHIPGTGRIDSLNVACAASILLHHFVTKKT